MAINQAARMADIQPFHVMEVMNHARQLEQQGRDIVHMEVGEPDFTTPAPIVDAGIQSLQNGQTQYTVALGLPALRTAIARHYRDQFDVEIDPSRVIITTGSSAALQMAVFALINPGDQVLTTDPGYPCNRHFVRLAEGHTVAVPVNHETDWQLTPELVEANLSPQSKALLLASPSNPTGTELSPARLRSLAKCAKQHGLALIVDEIYQSLVYGHKPHTVLSVDDQAIVINSFSKYFGMTGWRVGWMVVPETLVRDIEKLAQNLFIAPPTMSQHAALAAFRPETRIITEQRRLAFQQRRDFLLPALRQLGFDLPVEPTGAFYLYADCRRFSDDAQQFALKLLDETGVACTPGIDFGTYQADHHLRFAYTTSLEQLQLGVERIDQYIRTTRRL